MQQIILSGGKSEEAHAQAHAQAHGIKLHKCAECDNEFGLAHMLKAHMLTHTGEKKHKCAQCEKAFGHGHVLKRHMLTHTGEKSHKCAQCNKQFGKADNADTCFYIVGKFTNVLNATNHSIELQL